MIDLESMTDKQIENLFRNHEDKNARARPLYAKALEERARRSQARSRLDFKKSLHLLRSAAVEQRCVSYGDLASASGVPWNLARHQMNGSGGHLDRLLDICHANQLPMLPALCVNKNGLANGELVASALKGFADGARRLGFDLADEREFHIYQRDTCWEWGRSSSAARDTSLLLS